MWLALASLWADGASVAKVVAGHERTIMRLPGHVHGQGVKGVFPFDRKPGLSIDYFQTYWWRTHGPIAARLQKGALAYFQCHPLRHLYERRNAPAFDGVTELHWPNFASCRRRHGVAPNARGPVPGCAELCRTPAPCSYSWRKRRLVQP